MAHSMLLERSTDGVNWTTVTSWVSNGGAFVDWVSEQPNGTSGVGSPITVYYRFSVSNAAADVVGSRRLAAVAGNR